MLRGRTHQNRPADDPAADRTGVEGHGSPLEKALAGEWDLNVLFVSIQDYYLFQELYGPDLARQMDELLRKGLTGEVAGLTEPCEVSCLKPDPGEYLLLWPVCTTAAKSLADISYEVTLKVQEGLNRSVLQWTGRMAQLDAGHCVLRGPSKASRETRIFEALQEARRKAKEQMDPQRLEFSAQFRDILVSRKVTAVYQPIVDFSSGEILGWEALSRGPEQGPFRSPVMLFDAAERLGRLFALEKLCREKAINNLGGIAPSQKLFLNINPKTVVDPEFTPGKTLELMERAGLEPENIVFEITERHSVQDFGLFYKALDHYRSQGFKVAVDDAGAGFSGLTTIAQIQPDYIKIDMTLVRGIDRDPVKRALMETLVGFADKIGSRIIAEGIETKAEAACLLDIGVHFGQGYYLGRPAAPKPGLSIDPRSIKPAAALPRKFSCSLPVGLLASPAHETTKDVRVSEASHFFENNRQAASLVVTEGGRPVGLLMEHSLNRHLSGQFGVALYYRRPLETIMDRSPLVVEDTAPAEQAAAAAMRRERIKAYDDLIVCRGGQVCGVVSVQKLLNTLAQVQVEMAKGTNPLTGLPGNVTLEQEVEASVGRGTRFCIVYADLDNFKIYNDTYGFKNGDRVIKLTADILAWAVRRRGNPEARLYHIGGDDFVLTVRPDLADRLCRSTIRCFKRLVKACYCDTDRARGIIVAVGRDCVDREYPLISISLGVIEVAGPCTLLEIGERAAHVKKFAKAIPGNSSVWDRRAPLGTDRPECAAK